MTTPAVDNTHLTALVELITSAVQDIIQTYASAGHSVPTLSSTVPGPFDTPAATPPSLARAIQIVEGACTQLCASVGSPGQVLLTVCVIPSGPQYAGSFHELQSESSRCKFTLSRFSGTLSSSLCYSMRKARVSRSPRVERYPTIF